MFRDVSMIWHCMTDKQNNNYVEPNQRNVLFRLFTRNNVNLSELLIMSDDKSVLFQSRYFNDSLQTKILIHGYAETIKNTKMIDIKNGKIIKKYC